MKKLFKKIKNNGKKKLSLLILMMLFLKLFQIMKKKAGQGKIKKIDKNWQEFVKKEKKEIKQLETGEESPGQFCHDSFKLLKDFFIPYQGNEHKPKILRTKSLMIITAVLFLLKLTVSGYLFAIYPNPAAMQEIITSEILNLINQERQNLTLPPLASNSVLTKAANAKAQDMLEKNYFAHLSPGGKTPWQWIDRAQYGYQLAGENLAMDFSSARSAHQALMQSSSHKKNILDAQFQDLGLAVVSGELNGKQTNLLVELFATRQPTTLALKPTAQSNLLPSVVQPPVLRVQPNVLSAEGQTPVAQTPTAPPAISQSTDQNQASEPISTAQTSTNLQPRSQPPAKVLYFATADDQKISLGIKLVTISKYIYLTFLFIIVLLLLVNLVVKIKIQHKPIIIETLMVILLIIGLITIRWHVLEQAGNLIAVI